MAKHTWNLCLPAVLLVLVALNGNFVKCDLELDKLSINNKANSTESCIAKYCSVGEQKSGSKKINGLREVKGYKIAEDSLKHLSVLYGLFTLINDAGLSEQCLKEMTQVQDGVRNREIWALKMLDSSGHPSSGFMLGNNHWLGSQKGCNAVQRPLYITMSDRYKRIMKENLISTKAPFQINYNMVYAKHTSEWQVEIKFMTELLLHIGLCLPKSCTMPEIHNLTQIYFDQRLASAQNIFEFDAKVLLVKDLKLRDYFFLKKSVLLLILVLFVTALLTFLSWNHEENKEINNRKATDSAATTKKSSYLQETNNNEVEEIKSEPEITFYDTLMDSFSLKKNWKTIMDDSIAPDSIPIINGIKSTACIVILSFHMIWFSFYAISNPAVMFSYAEEIRFQFVANAPLLVDMFFTISGFLVTYNFLRNRSRMNEIKENGLFKNIQLFGKMLLHRYIRLSPVYLMVLLLTEIATSHIVDTSKFWVHERSDLNCQKYWWRNLLYIQNMYHPDKLCACWSWSMACEMQFYILSLFLLFVFSKKEILGKVLFEFCASTFIIMQCSIAILIKFVPSFDVMYHTGLHLYTAPWARITPYMFGCLGGYVLHSHRKEILQLPRKRVYQFWSFSIFVVIGTLHCTMNRSLHPLITSVVMVIGRVLTGSIVSWFLIATSCGYTNRISEFFSSKAFVRFNKVTYAIYLLNPLIITVFFGHFSSGTDVDPLLIMLLTFGVTLLTAILSVIFTLFFELPYFKLSNHVLRKPQKVLEKSN